MQPPAFRGQSGSELNTVVYYEKEATTKDLTVKWVTYLSSKKNVNFVTFKRGKW
jgi:hypothetical protein